MSSLLHKTNSVLNFLKPIEILELTDRYTNTNNTNNTNSNNNIYQYQNTNYTSRKNTNNINKSFNKYNIKTNRAKYNRYELSKNNFKKIYQIENNIPNISSKKKINQNKKLSNIINLSDKNLGYMNERYIKMIVENKKLKDKLYLKETVEKIEIEKEINKLKEENIILNAINEEIKKNLKEKNNIIEKLENDINNYKIIIQELSKDKSILIEEISELNQNLINKIKPKLTKNENYLLSLEHQFNILKKENDSLIENDIKQKAMIKNFKNKNKISKINNRKHNTNLFNISKSKSKSTEDIFSNKNNSSHSTTKRSKISSKSKTKINKNSISKNKISPKNKFKIRTNIKSKKKLKKYLSQKNIKTNCENNTNNISEIIYKKNTAIKKKKNKDLFVKNANVLIGTNKNKEITLSLLSSFNEDKIY